MGASQSSRETRSVSLDNPTPAAGVIDISNEVVERLKLGMNKVKETTASQQQNSQTNEKRAVPVPTTPPTPSKSSPVVVPVPAPVPAYIQTPSSINVPAVGTLPAVPLLTAMEVRRQKEMELMQNDQMWRTRMTQLEETLNKTNAIMEKEYSVAIDEVRKRFTNPTGTRQSPPCQDFKANVIACYRKHPGEALKCAEEVALFRNCISVNRVMKLDSTPVAVVPPKGA